MAQTNLRCNHPSMRTTDYEAHFSATLQTSLRRRMGNTGYRKDRRGIGATENLKENKNLALHITSLITSLYVDSLLSVPLAAKTKTIAQASLAPNHPLGT